MGCGAKVVNEKSLIDNQAAPLVFTDIVGDLKQLGIASSDTLLVHASMSSLGWVAGGAQTVVDALISSVKDGTLVMPTHTPGNTDPANWSNPPVPESWWSQIREEMPAFDPAKTPTLGMGRVPELFRTYPNVRRSDHPVCSFAAFGPLAEVLTKAVPFQPEFGVDSTLDRLRSHGAKVLLLGATHESNTTLHLAEHLSDFTKVMIEEGCAMMVFSQRKWVRFKMLSLETDDFCKVGEAFEEAFQNQPEILSRGKVGKADCLLFDMTTMVTFATDWMTQNRK